MEKVTISPCTADVEAALAEPGLEVEGLWSHFAVADEAAKTATTDAQLARYTDALAAAGAGDGRYALGSLEVVVEDGAITGDAPCRATDVTYRVDTAGARDFLDDFVTLP